MRAMFPHANWIGPAGWYHLAAFGVGIPLLAIRNWRRVARNSRALPDRMTHFRSTALTLALFTAVSVLVARVQWIDLFPRPVLSLRGLAAGLAMYAVAVAFMRPRWRRAVERRAPIVRLFMPADAHERAWWIAVAVLAGVGEEITWRGVQTALLAVVTGSYWVAALLSALSFGVGHMVQGWRAVAIIGVFALCFQTVVWLSGSLYIAMLVHVAYDVTAGLTYGRLGRELGYAAPEAPASPVSA